MPKKMSTPLRRRNPNQDVSEWMKPKTAVGRAIIEGRKRVIASGQRLRTIAEILQEREDSRTGK